MWGCMDVTEAIEVNSDALEMSIRIVCQFACNCMVRFLDV
jgi:hypothetical protein